MSLPSWDLRFNKEIIRLSTTHFHTRLKLGRLRWSRDEGRVQVGCRFVPLLQLWRTQKSETTAGIKGLPSLRFCYVWPLWAARNVCGSRCKQDKPNVRRQEWSCFVRRNLLGEIASQPLRLVGNGAEGVGCRVYFETHEYRSLLIGDGQILR